MVHLNRSVSTLPRRRPLINLVSLIIVASVNYTYIYILHNRCDENLIFKEFKI